MSDETPKKVPLVYYDGKGTRHVVGEAQIDRVDETGIHIKAEVTPGEFAEKFKDPNLAFSFAPIGFFEY